MIIIARFPIAGVRRRLPPRLCEETLYGMGQDKTGHWTIIVFRNDHLIQLKSYPTRLILTRVAPTTTAGESARRQRSKSQRPWSGAGVGQNSTPRNSMRITGTKCRRHALCTAADECVVVQSSCSAISTPPGGVSCQHHPPSLDLAPVEQVIVVVTLGKPATSLFRAICVLSHWPGSNGRILCSGGSRSFRAR